MARASALSTQEGGDALGSLGEIPRGESGGKVAALFPPLFQIFFSRKRIRNIEMLRKSENIIRRDPIAEKDGCARKYLANLRPDVSVHPVALPILSLPNESRPKREKEKETTMTAVMTMISPLCLPSLSLSLSSALAHCWPKGNGQGGREGK